MTPISDDTAVINAVAEDDLAAADHRDDGLAEELAKAAPKKWWNKSTVVLGALVLLVGGFVGGLQAQKQWGTSPAGAGNGGRAAAFGGGAGRYGGGAGFPAGGGNFPGGGNAAGGNSAGGRNAAGGGNFPGGGSSAGAAGTTGTVKLVDGSTIYVQTPDGNVVTVKTDGKTKVATAKAGKLADVKAGQSVTVQGAAGADGIVTATSVTAQPK